MEKHRDIPLRTRNDFLQAGRKLVKKHCFGKKLPLFLPIDGVPEPFNDVKQNDMANTDREKALSKVYQALSKLDERIVVLCGVIFNQEQSRILGPGHDTNTDNATVSKQSIEGKSDFIILGPNYVVLIDAISINCEANDELIETSISIKSRYQKKSFELIEKILSMPDKSVPMRMFKNLSFICFPLIEKERVVLNFTKACSKQENTVGIMKLDLEDIQMWWDTNVKNQLSARDDSVGDSSLLTLVLPVLLVLCSVGDETIKSLTEPIDDFVYEKVQSNINTHLSSDIQNHETSLVQKESEHEKENRLPRSLKFKNFGSTQPEECHSRSRRFEQKESESGFLRQKRFFLFLGIALFLLARFIQSFLIKILPKYSETGFIRRKWS